MRKLACLAAVIVVLSGCGSKGPDIPSVVASIDGREITADRYLSTVHRSAGEGVLRNLLEQQMMVAWAKHQGVAPTSKQIDDWIRFLKREGQYDQAAEQLGEDAVRGNVEVLLSQANLAGKFYKISDKELQDMYQAGKDRYVHGPRKFATFVINQDRKAVQKAEKAVKEGMNFDQAAMLYSSRTYTFRGPLRLWIAEDQGGLPAEMTEAAAKTKVGDVSKIIKLGQQGNGTTYAILKVTVSQPKTNLKFADVRNEIKTFAALQKTSPEAGTDFQARLNERKKKAKVKVDIAEFQGVVKDFESPPSPQEFGGMVPQRVTRPPQNPEVKPK